MLKRIALTVVFICVAASSFSQKGFNLIDSKKDKIKFQLINNLIVIPVKVNGVELSFLLDSGVSKPILFNIFSFSDSLKIKNSETVFLRGLGGEGSIEAFKSNKNVVKIGAAINVNQEIYVVFDESINFTPRLGIPIHGIIGYDIFKDFIVEVNYGNKKLKLHNPVTYKYKKCRKCESFDLTMSHNKPYLDGIVETVTGDVPVKLLIDTGGSDALWLFEDKEKDLIPVENHYFEDYLGKGLSGSVYGKRSKLKSFSLKSFKFEDVNVAFPDSSSISVARSYKERNGSISGELLKRFNIIFDYGNQKITLKKNGNFKKPFHYNKSGIVLEQRGVRIVKQYVDSGNYRTDSETDTAIKIVLEPSYKFAIKPAFSIVELRKDSPAERAGLMLEDVILSVNNKDSSQLEMHEINEMFSGEDGKVIRIKVDRNGMLLSYVFRLEKLF